MYNRTEPVRCLSCEGQVSIIAFPALFRPPDPQRANVAPVLGDEAGCFFHGGKKAVTACESCGRFLCSLCTITIGNRQLCSSCIGSGKRKGKLRDLTRQRFLYDNLALSLATLPLLVWPMTVVTAPAAIFVAVRYWRTPLSILKRSRWRFILAVALAGLQVSGWVFLVVFLLRQF